MSSVKPHALAQEIGDEWVPSCWCGRGFAESYAKQVVAAMQDGVEERWCAVEGCQSEPTLIDLPTGEFVCRTHLDHGKEVVSNV